MRPGVGPGGKLDDLVAADELAPRVDFLFDAARIVSDGCKFMSQDVGIFALDTENQA